MSKSSEIMRYKHLESRRCFFDDVECAICNNPIFNEVVTVARYVSEKSEKYKIYNLVVCGDCNAPLEFTRRENHETI